MSDKDISLHNLQQKFTQSILVKNDESICELIAESEVPASDRLNIYANNTFVSLKEVLVDLFSAVDALVERPFFLLMSDEFIRTHPPMNGCLLFYGEQFSSFIANFKPAQEHKYLSDIAQLEWLIHASSIAENNTPLTLVEFNNQLENSLIKDKAETILLSLSPSCKIMESEYPVMEIWEYSRTAEANPKEEVSNTTGENKLKSNASIVPDIYGGGGFLIIYRNPDNSTNFELLAEEEYIFLSAIQNGKNYLDAVEVVLEKNANYPLAEMLTKLFELKIFKGEKL